VGGALFCNLKLGTESVIDRALGFSGTLPQRKTSVGPDFGRCRTTHRNTGNSSLGAGKLSNPYAEDDNRLMHGGGRNSDNTAVVGNDVI
jgi:hypothetical protein